MKTAQQTQKTELLNLCKKMTRSDIAAWLELLQAEGETYSVLVVWEYLESLDN